jgi:hypothetical protein
MVGKIFCFNSTSLVFTVCCGCCLYDTRTKQKDASKIRSSEKKEKKKKDAKFNIENNFHIDKVTFFTYFLFLLLLELLLFLLFCYWGEVFSQFQTKV